MLIIEGTDLVGKTTLSEMLLSALNIRKLGYVYRHLTRLPEGFDFCGDYVNLASQKIVQDRFHMSEPIYSLIRGEDDSPLSPEKYRQVDASLRQIGAFTVIVTADTSVIKKRWREGEMYRLDQALAVNGRFVSIVNQRGFWNNYKMDFDHCIHLSVERDWSDKDVEEIIKKYMARRYELEHIRRSYDETHQF